MAQLVHWLTTSTEFFQHLGLPGFLLYAGGMVLVAMACGPLSPLAIFAGAMFGLGPGLFVVTLGVNLSASANFLIARYLARNAVAKRLEKHEKFRLIDAAVGREGWKLIGLLRFVPMPFGLANYGFGITAIRFWPYLFATIPTTFPANLFFVWLGATGSAGLHAAAGTERPRHPGEYVFMVIGLIATFVAMIYVTKIARAALAKAAPAIEA